MISDWELVTQESVNQYGALTGDEQWIHVDVERAKKEMPLTGTIAHGLFIISLFPKWLRSMAFPVVTSATKSLNYGFDKIRFITPIPVGSRVRGHFEIKSTETNNNVTKVIYTVTVEIENQPKPAIVAESIIQYTI
jgi:acyl dehydratase